MLKSSLEEVLSCVYFLTLLLSLQFTNGGNFFFKTSLQIVSKSDCDLTLGFFCC
jgi:hypothetical protein